MFSPLYIGHFKSNWVKKFGVFATIHSLYLFFVLIMDFLYS